MPNTNPQAILVANTKIRTLADRFGKTYNTCKMMQAEAIAEGWVGMFPNDAEVIVDGAATDGRTVILNSDVSAFITYITTFINQWEASANAVRNNVLKIAVNPEQV